MELSARTPSFPRSFLTGLVLFVVPPALQAQVGDVRQTPAQPPVRTGISWPRSVGTFDSLRLRSSLPAPWPRGLPPVFSSTLPHRSYMAYRGAPPPREAPPRTQCPMPVYPGGLDSPMPGSARGRDAVRPDTTFLRGPVCDNPLDGRR